MNRIRDRYSFVYMDGDDLAQEAYIIALDRMSKYDSSKGPIFNYLSITVNNRIKNVIRDFMIKELNTCSLDNIQDEYETIGNSMTTSKEFWELIDEHLSPSLRKDYLKLKSGMSIPIQKKHRVINEIRRIINETL